MSADLWSIAVDVPMPTTLTYSCPPELRDQIHRGLRARVPLGKRQSTGVILGPSTGQATAHEIKSILELDHQYPAIPESYVSWIEWLSSYYLHPIGQVAEMIYPPLTRNERTRGSKKKSVIPDILMKPPKILNTEQAQVVEKVLAQGEGFETHLLFGVTGSGKTEVYLELLSEVLKQGKAGLFLVPEISLTPQLVRRFVERFGDQVAALHSQLTDREKTEQWWSIIEGQKKILVGARSSLFCPIPNLGMVVVDEEHETSYKQEEKLKYHARDAAIVLASKAKCPVLLGSATPSIETWKNSLEGKYHLHRLNNRYGSRPLPDIEIVDIRTKEKANTGHLPQWMSLQLFNGLQATLTDGFQSAIFLNRRGFSPQVICNSCGYSPECENCDIHLTLHGQHSLVCHYCNYQQSHRELCPKCSEPMHPLGMGTEKIETDLQTLFPQARIARADRDEISNREQMEEMISKMENGQIDILVGTQMIAKGLDFPRLKFVGLALADIGFNLPDFRSTERSFQLITQMSGRAGRHGTENEKPGQVVIQTLNPDHPSLLFAPKADFEGFAKWELEQREQLNYPPFHRMAVVRIQGADINKVEKTCSRVRAALVQWTKDPNLAAEILGPAQAPLARIKRQHRFHLLIKSRSVKTLTSLGQALISMQKDFDSGVRLSVDVDPLHLL